MGPVAGPRRLSGPGSHGEELLSVSEGESCDTAAGHEAGWSRCGEHPGSVLSPLLSLSSAHQHGL